MIHRGGDIRINPTHRHQVSLHFYKHPPTCRGTSSRTGEILWPQGLKGTILLNIFLLRCTKSWREMVKKRNGAGCVSGTSFGPKNAPKTKFWGEMVTGAQTITIYHTPEGASHRGSWRPLLWVYFTPNSSDLTRRNTWKYTPGHFKAKEFVWKTHIIFSRVVPLRYKKW